MNLRAPCTLAAALMLLTPAASRAALSAYTQNFETMVAADPAALSADGWIVYGNVFTPTLVYIYGYGPFPAPNPGGGFCAVDVGQGGPEQGLQQLSVYSDYNNTDHGIGRIIESNVYREFTIGAADVGKTWTLQFDAKLGNLVSPSKAFAFIKTLDPNNNWTMTNFERFETTNIPATWGTYFVSLDITAGLVGQVLQIGFMNTATGYVSSAVFYDNIVWSGQTTGVPAALRPGSLALRPAVPNPFTNSTRIDYSVSLAGPVDLAILDVAGRRVATLFRGAVEAGPHSAAWNGRLDDGRLAPAGAYRCVLKTPAGLQSRSLVLTH